MNDLKLYQYNVITGYWDYQRTCAADTAQEWLEIFQKDCPTGHFKLAYSKPKGDIR